MNALRFILPGLVILAAICSKLIGDDEEYHVYYRRAVASGYDGDKIKNVIRKLDAEI